MPDSGTDDVSVLDTATNTVIATVAVGDAPSRAAVNADGTRVYVTNNGSDTVSVIAVDETGGTGLASCAGDVPNGNAIDTNSVGAKTFTAAATDNAGNTTSVRQGYSVVYAFRGFFSPIDNVPAVNVGKAGSAIPVKFGLGGNQGLSIFAAGYPRSQPMYCDASATYDGIEETVTAGSSSLSYDATTGRYDDVWKTDKAWANTCRKLTVRLTDGTDHVAYFMFKK